MTNRVTRWKNQTLQTKDLVLGTPPYESRFPAPNQMFVEYEDFQGTWLDTDAGPADRWSTTAGAGTGNAKALTVANSLNGEVTIKTASDDGTHAQNGSTFTGINLGWKANSGGLSVEARIHVDAITAVAIFVGFTDTISTTVELPIFLLNADLDSDADNAFGIVYDTDGTTAQWCLGGVKATADTTPVYHGTAPAAATYVTVKVECDASGIITGYINGVPFPSRVENAVTVTTALTPAVIIANRSAAQRILTMDYIRATQNRV